MVFDRILRGVYQYGGYIGNYFFFMLSGFLMVHGYREKISSGDIDITEFIFKRIAKIYPLYFLSNLFILIYNLSFCGLQATCNMKDLIQVFLMVCTGWIEDGVPYNVPTWFVCVLLLCYIGFFFVTCWYKKNRNFYYLAVVAFVFWGYILEISNMKLPFCYVHNGEGYFNFFLGMLLYDVIQYFKKDGNEKKLILFEVIGFILLVFISYGTLEFGFSNFCGDLRIVLSVIILPYVIIYAVCVKTIEKILCIKTFVILGKLSMSLFFWHLPVLLVFNHIYFFQRLSSEIQLGMYLLVLIVVCAGSYYLIERVGLKNIKKLFNR